MTRSSREPTCLRARTRHRDTRWRVRQYHPDTRLGRSAPNRRRRGRNHICMGTPRVPPTTASSKTGTRFCPRLAAKDTKLAKANPSRYSHARRKATVPGCGRDRHDHGRAQFDTAPSCLSIPCSGAFFDNQSSAPHPPGLILAACSTAKRRPW